MDSVAIARVIARGAFIPVLVVASKPSHELLTICELAGLNRSHEVVGLLAAQRGCDSTVVKDLDIPVLSHSMCESEIVDE